MKNYTVNWESVSPGIWEAVIGDGGLKNSLTETAGVKPKSEELKKLSCKEFPFDSEVKAYEINSKIIFCFPLGEDEVLYGGGLHYKNSVINSAVLRLKADHYNGRDDGRTHAPVPFWLSGKGYGVFIDTANYVDLYMGSANRADSKKGYRNLDRNTDSNWSAQPVGEYVEAAVNNTEQVKVVVFAGNTVLETVMKFNLYCGGGFIPPKWGFGIWKRVPHMYTAEQVLENINEFSERGFPLEVIGLEPGWQSCSYPCSYEWDKSRFPDPSGLIKSALEKGVRLNLWENAYVSPESKIFGALLPLSGSHLVWGGIVPDYTMEKAAEVLREQHKREHVDIGISGYKLDECDGYDSWLWPDHAEFPSGTTAEQMRNSYGLLLQKMIYGIFKAANKRTYGLTRAANAGGNSFPFVLYNDCYDFGEFLTGVCNCGFLGVMWVPEVRGSADSNEWLRRCQLVCFSPMAMINSWASDIEPWTFKDVSDQVREVFLLRKKLLPYLYSAYARYAFEGKPPFRSMVMEQQDMQMQNGGVLDDTKNPYAVMKINAVTDQFVMGDNLIIAPFAPKQFSREVILPDSDWFDFYSGSGIKGGRKIKVNTADTADRIPVYVRDGGIVPMLSDDPEVLEIKYYGNKHGSFLLFDDDGESFDYENGAYDSVLISVCRDDSKEAVLTSEYIHNGLKVKNYKQYKLVDMSKKHY